MSNKEQYIGLIRSLSEAQRFPDRQKSWDMYRSIGMGLLALMRDHQSWIQLRDSHLLSAEDDPYRSTFRESIVKDTPPHGISSENWANRLADLAIYCLTPTSIEDIAQIKGGGLKPDDVKNEYATTAFFMLAQNNGQLGSLPPVPFWKMNRNTHKGDGYEDRTHISDYEKSLVGGTEQAYLLAMNFSKYRTLKVKNIIVPLIRTVPWKKRLNPELIKKLTRLLTENGIFTGCISPPKRGNLWFLKTEDLEVAKALAQNLQEG